MRHLRSRSLTRDDLFRPPLVGVGGRCAGSVGDRADAGKERLLEAYDEASPNAGSDPGGGDRGHRPPGIPGPGVRGARRADACPLLRHGLPAHPRAHVPVPEGGRRQRDQRRDRRIRLLQGRHHRMACPLRAAARARFDRDRFGYLRGVPPASVSVRPLRAPSMRVSRRATGTRLSRAARCRGDQR